MCTRYGKRFEKWFCSTKPSSLKDRLAANTVHTLVRMAAGIPHYEMVPISEAWKISQHLVQLQNDGLQPCLITTPSQAIRIGLAALDRGRTLEGTTFLLGAEPLTPTRLKSIEQSGAKAVTTYGFSEGGNVGSQCRGAPAIDDIHVSLDAYAVIQRPRQVAESEVVDALLLTALRPSCPKVLFNTEIGDYAVMTSHNCGCLFGEVGYHQHLHTIRSFDKLTGAGMTFIGSDLFQLMEEILPQQFGGCAMDYQLVERQDEQGLPRYSLLVSPEVGRIDERRLRETFLNELGKKWSVYKWMVKIWRDADVLTVKRQRPVATPRGKIFPFRTLGPE
jgi:phenylacetate-coenzyme A ligase PaaK-like adenylate-forming protein